MARYIITAIEFANDRSVYIRNGQYCGGPNSEVGLVLRRIPDNATQAHHSNIPDPKDTHEKEQS